MKFIVKRRQTRLSKAQVLDKTKYQVGNIVLAINHPVKNNETKGLSQELALTVKGVYYVKSVAPSHLRLIGLFTGEERTLPREYCVKLSLANISEMQVQLENLQMQKVSQNLFKANRYLPPDSAKTWNFLLGKNSDPLDYNTSDFTPDLPDDVESENNPSVHAETDPQIRNRTTRSGRSYLTLPNFPRSILKPARLADSFASVPHLLTPPASDSDNSKTPDLPGQVTLVNQAVPGHKLQVSFNSDLYVRFISGKVNHDFSQTMLVHTDLEYMNKFRKTSLMLSVFGLDMSQSELCYKYVDSEPNPVNDVLDLE